MGKGPFPIIITLIILAVVFGGWLIARYQGLFYHKTAEDVSICTNPDRNVLNFKWKDHSYSIVGYNSYCSDGEGVLHLSFHLAREYSRDISTKIDTSQIKFIEIYGKQYSIAEIAVCE